MIASDDFKSPYYNLKILIEKKGFTQSEVAKKICMDRATFNVKINRTKGRDFTFQEAIEISNVLNEKIDSFF